MNRLSRHSFLIAFGLGALAVLWVAAAVASSHFLVLVMTAVIGAVYVFAALELRHYREATAALNQALSDIPADLQHLSDWLITLPASLQNAVRQRIEGERQGLPGPALTPYLVGLLVMLGMLGTFFGHGGHAQRCGLRARRLQQRGRASAPHFLNPSKAWAWPLAPRSRVWPPRPCWA